MNCWLGWNRIASDLPSGVYRVLESATPAGDLRNRNVQLGELDPGFTQQRMAYWPAPKHLYTSDALNASEFINQG